MLSRRGFIGSLLAAGAGMVLDPERLLWVPGRKTIFVPPLMEMRYASKFIGVGEQGLTYSIWIKSVRADLPYGDEYGWKVENDTATWGAPNGYVYRVRRESAMEAAVLQEG